MTITPAACFLFWASIFFILYTFGGYVLLIFFFDFFKRLLPFKKKTLSNNKEKLPDLTLIISVYNEENIIEKKLLNTLELDYPKHKLEILVVSDMSTDSTDDIVETFADRRVKLLKQDFRGGKTAALNMAVPLARGELIVFSDANSMYDKEALKELVQHFARPDIGCVTGRTKYISVADQTVAETSGFYTRLENITKGIESRLSSCVGADGAIFAIRKNLFLPLNHYDINDFVIPLNIIEQGYRVVMEKKAFCFEETSEDMSGEFNRQVRITCRTLRAIFNNKALLNPFYHPLFSFQLFSHKIIRFLLPAFVLIAIITNSLLLTGGLLYKVILCMQLSCYILFIWGYFEQKKKKKNRISTFAYTFGSVCLAFLMGWVKYFSGETYTTWKSERERA